MTHPPDGDPTVEWFRFAPQRRSELLGGRLGTIINRLVWSVVVLVVASWVGNVVVNIYFRNRGTPHILVSIVLLSSVLIYNLAVTGAVFVTTSDIALDNNGIRLYLSENNYTSVSRHTLCEADIKEVSVKKLIGTRGWTTKLFVVRVPGLAIRYRLAGLYYRVCPTPVFVVTLFHENHKRLLDYIREAAAELNG